MSANIRKYLVFSGSAFTYSTLIVRAFYGQGGEDFHDG